MPALKAPTKLTSCYPHISGHLKGHFALRRGLPPQENRSVVRHKECSCLPRGGEGVSGCSKGCSLLPGKPGFVALPALLLAGSQPASSIPSCYEIRLSRAGNKPGTRKQSKVNTAVVHPTGMQCSSKAEKRIPDPSPSGMLWEHCPLPACPVSPQSGCTESPRGAHSPPARAGDKHSPDRAHGHSAHRSQHPPTEGESCANPACCVKAKAC